MTLFADLFALIQAHPECHSRIDPLWKVMRVAARTEVEACFSSAEAEPISFGPLGDIRFPFHSMGNINSLDLFGIDELIILAFYDANRSTYSKVVDFGANIGFHSFGMGRSGFQVRSFEPDPHHFELLKRNLDLNGVTSELHNSAVSLEAGQAEFVRVLGNTTGSHIAGAKKDPYGDLERFDVEIEAAAEHLAWADLAKIDIEGHEAALLTGLTPETWATTDAIMEVGTEENAKAIYDYLAGGPINMFSQLKSWGRVESLADMPTSHRDGSLFISSKSEMPW